MRAFASVLLHIRWSCFGIHCVSMVLPFAPTLLACYVVAELPYYANAVMGRYYYTSTHAHSTHICMHRPQVPLTTKKKKRKKRGTTKPIGAIPEDVLNRAKELAGDYQKLSKLLRKKAFREVGELNKPCKCQCRCGVRRQSGRRRVR